MKSRWLGLGLLAITAACGGSSVESASDEADVTADSSLKLCAAVRGNGTSIIAHFVSMARIVDHYGVVDGIAGGSSASITSFVYQSMRQNPAIAQCGEKACSGEKLAARVALALKSLEGYGLAIVKSEEGVEVGDLVGVVARLKREVAARGIEALASKDTVLAAKKLKEVLSIPEFESILNPELGAMLEDVQHLDFNVKEVKAAFTTFGKSDLSDNRLFFRPGLLHWDAVVPLFGRVADFYAGEAPADRSATKAWLDGCAAASVDKSWEEASALPFPSGGTCGEAFGKLVSDYRAKARASGAVSKRLRDRVADPSPVRALLSTSVLEGDAVPAYEKSRASYLAGSTPTGSVPFEPSFEDIKFGYWGSDKDTAAVLSSRDRPGSTLKTKKASSLGNASWREVLSASPAEPGLSRFVDLADGRISAGGWSDLAPTTVLETMGCERIVYVTREGDESGFATGIAKHLGMDEAAWSSLYDLENPDSGFSRSLEKADAVWCTNWNAFTDSQQREKIADAWKAPLETHEGFEGVRTFSPYSGTTPSAGKPGCTPGISGGARFPK